MILSPDKIADLRAKELELLQTVIARMANYGATLKNYCITLITAVAGFALTVQRPIALLLGLLPVIVCALLNAQYLRNERRFRQLFHAVRQQDWATLPAFNINLTAAPPQRYLPALLSWSVMAFYGPLAVAVVAVALVSGYIHGQPL